MKKLLLAGGALAAVYAGFLGVTYGAMRQPPEAFARYMSKLPAPAMMALPFRPLWNAARAGRLGIGDPAPDFELATVDRQARIRLSTLRQDRPAVLIFGSFT